MRFPLISGATLSLISPLKFERRVVRFSPEREGQLNKFQVLIALKQLAAYVDYGGHWHRYARDRGLPLT